MIAAGKEVVCCHTLGLVQERQQWLIHHLPFCSEEGGRKWCGNMCNDLELITK